MKAEWETRYVAVFFSEVERFLTDLAGASLSAEYEHRRQTLEKKISTVRKISPPPFTASKIKIYSAVETEGEADASEPQVDEARRRVRSWSYPPTGFSEHRALVQEEEPVILNQEADQSEVVEETSETPKTGGLREGGGAQYLETFERLRQAYHGTVSSTRQRSASVPCVPAAERRPTRKPNPEYIHQISTFTGFVRSDKKAENTERKPNKKGFNVVWQCSNGETG